MLDPVPDEEELDIPREADEMGVSMSDSGPGSGVEDHGDFEPGQVNGESQANALGPKVGGGRGQSGSGYVRSSGSRRLADELSNGLGSADDTPSGANKKGSEQTGEGFSGVMLGKLNGTRHREGVKKGETQSWRLEKRIGEGAFSSVWSAVPCSPSSFGISTTSGNKSRSANDSVNGDKGDLATDFIDQTVSVPSSTTTTPAAIKILSRSTCTTSARHRISFLREVEVLRAISHPNIVTFLTSFSTPSYHCLVLEKLGGGELFELISVEENRARMLLEPPHSDTSTNPTLDGGEGFVRRLFTDLCKGVGFLHGVGVVHRDIKLESECAISAQFLVILFVRSAITFRADARPPPHH